MVITALGLGAGLGIGLWALVVGLFPPRPALGAVLARASAVSPAPLPAPFLSVSDPGWVARLGRPFVGPLQALGLPGPACSATWRLLAGQRPSTLRSRPHVGSLACWRQC